MMKRIFVLLTALMLVFGLSVSAHALLVDNLDGTITDTDTNLMWLQDANLAGATMNWNDAMTWADTLVYGGYDDWRLPETVQPDPSCSFQSGGVSYGNNCTGSEMGHLYNTEGITSSTPGLFTNVQAGIHWSGTEYAPDLDYAWRFSFGNSYQGAYLKVYGGEAWAVRPADVAPVPEPGTLLLLGSGLVGIVACRKRLGRHG